MPVKIQIFTKVNPPILPSTCRITIRYYSRLDLLYNVITNELIKIVYIIFMLLYLYKLIYLIRLLLNIVII